MHKINDSNNMLLCNSKSHFKYTHRRADWH